MQQGQSPKPAYPRARLNVLGMFFSFSVGWLLVDRVTKTFANAGEVGQVIAPGVPGVFDFLLVHNAGAAWGIMSNSTAALGLFSLAVCAAVVLYMAFGKQGQHGVVETVALALVFAGGLGNAVDRMAHGYVIDFIHTTFVDFPVFNVADIGITCGTALFVGTLIAEAVLATKTLRQPAGSAHDEGSHRA